MISFAHDILMLLMLNEKKQSICLRVHISRIRLTFVDETIIFIFAEVLESQENEEDIDPNAGRFVRYQFTPQFLRLKIVGAT
jgi:hypothetical protein